MNMGERIKQLRLERGVSQEALAHACHTTQQIISCYEKNTVKQPRILDRLAGFFGVSESYLRYGEETSPQARSAGQPTAGYGGSVELNPQERRLVEAFRALSTQEQRYEIQRFVALQEYRAKR